MSDLDERPLLTQSRRRQGAFTALRQSLRLPSRAEVILLWQNPEIDLSSRKVRHDIRDEKFTGFHVVPPIAMYQQFDAGVFVLSDQVDGLGHSWSRWCSMIKTMQ